jgi:alpha-amylase/alpha-mannosidase (GH57 family)
MSGTISLTSEEGEVVEESVEVCIVTSAYSHPKLRLLPSNGARYHQQVLFKVRLRCRESILGKVEFTRPDLP